MTAKFYAILTHQGAARLANATALGTKLNLTQMAVGDAGGKLSTPDPAQTKLINQTRIAPLNMLSIDDKNASQIIAEQIIPENEGGWWIREIGLYDDAGVLIAVANCPETYKPLLQEGSGRTQTIRMLLVVSSTSSITLKIDPSVVLATREYADNKAIEAKSYADEKMRKHEQSRNHPDGTLAAKGFVQLSSATNSTSETLAATPKAVKEVYDFARKMSFDTLYPVGIVTWFAQNKDPNTLFPGTTWEYIGENRTIRLGSANGSDVMTTGGSDAVALGVGHLPAHGHTFSANTNSFDYGTKTTSNFDYGTKTTSIFDYGTKTTSSNGDHTHGGIPKSVSWNGWIFNAQWNSVHDTSTTNTNPAGAHTHTVAIGSHSHSVAIGAHTHTVGIGAHSHSVSGTTANTGSGTEFSVTNSFIKLMGWYRIA